MRMRCRWQEWALQCVTGLGLTPIKKPAAYTCAVYMRTEHWASLLSLMHLPLAERVLCWIGARQAAFCLPTLSKGLAKSKKLSAPHSTHLLLAQLLLCKGLLLSIHDGCLQQVCQGGLTPRNGLLHLLCVAPVHLQFPEDGVPALPAGVWYLCNIWELWDDMLRQSILRRTRLRVETSY